VPDATAERWRHWLLSQAAGHRNDAILASMLASQCAGLGAMPNRLGLAADAFNALIAHHFPTLRPSDLPQPQRQLDPDRADEREELARLLPDFLDDSAGAPSERPDPSPSGLDPRRDWQRRWMAEIIAAGCMGSDHLWQDLGLWNRAELSRLMEQNFPALAQRNCRDMKWKRFLYKQLCETEGIYTCRSPSCEVCVDYHACFGPEN
jgi:nitrogen fixation protein NifQ